MHWNAHFSVHRGRMRVTNVWWFSPLLFLTGEEMMICVWWFSPLFVLFDFLFVFGYCLKMTGRFTGEE